jgi:surface protein
MFKDATAFNGAVNSWVMTNVWDARGMFSNAVNFNQPLDNWDVSNVNDMSSMFSAATAFNQDISKWNITDVYTLQNFMNGKSSLNYSGGYYTALLISWASQAVRVGIIADFGTIKYNYTLSSEASRDVLIRDYLWQLTDGGAV